VDPERDNLFHKAARVAGSGHNREVDSMQAAGSEDEINLDQVRVETAGEEDQLDLDSMLAGTDDFSLPLDGEEPLADASPPELDAAEEPQEEAGPSRRLDSVTYSQLRPMEKMRVALMGDAFERSLAIRDSNRSVALSAIKSPRVKENEVVAYAANRSLSHDVIRYIATRRDWVKLYAVKLNLVMNPKTPMSVAMTLVGHLNRNDIRKVAQSKAIPSALATAAKRRMQQRR
jgi:hypothetical protein